MSSFPPVQTDRPSLLDRWRTTSSGWSVTGAVLGVVVSGAVLVDGALHRGDPEAVEAEASYSSAAVDGAPVDPVLRMSAERIADALRDPGVVAPDLAAEVMTIESTGSGWLLLVTTEALLPDDAAEVCHALEGAGALPGTRVFVADARRHLVRAC